MWSLEPDHSALRRSSFRALVCLLVLFLIALLPQSAPSAISADLPLPQPKVLILYGASTKLPAHALFNSGLLPALKAAGIDDSHQYQEYLDLEHSHGRGYRHELAKYLRTKYEDDRFDAIIIFQPDALQFMLQEGKGLFGGVPIVAAVPTKEIPGTGSSGRRVIQLVYGFDSVSTIQHALALLPDTKEIIVIGGPTAADYSHLGNALEALKQFEGGIAIRPLTNHSMPEILKEVAAKRDHAIILYTRLSRDAAGKGYIPRAAEAEISRVASSPVFGLHDSLLGYGIVGGSLLSFQAVGKEVARLSVDLVRNRLGPQVSLVTFQKHTPMFDWAEMQRWGVDRARLPRERVLINYHPGFWEQYWGYALSALLFLAGEASLIAYLFWSRRKRIQSEKELKKSDELLKSYLHSSVVISWMKDEEGRYVFLSDSYQQRFQVRFEEWKGKTDFELWPEADAERFRLDDQAVLSGREPLERIEMVTDTKGVSSWWFSSKFLFQDVAGKRFIGGLGVDITEHRRAEEAQLQSAQYARSLIEASLDPLVTISKDGKVMDVNQATVEATGIRREELIDTDFSDYFTDPARARIGYETVWSDGMVRDYPLSLRHVSGRVTEVLYNATLYRDPQGEVLGIFAAARDITEQKRAEAALRESELRYRTVAEFTSDWEYWIMPDGTLRYMSPSCEQVSGYGPDEYYADPQLLTRIIHPDDLHIYAGHRDTLTDETEHGHLDFRILTKGGECRWIAHVCRRVCGVDGEPLGHRASNRDITERKQAEEKVRQLNDELESRVRERTAELERSNRELEGFCYAISHEFRAPIARLEGFSTLMLEIAADGDESLLHCARRIVAASTRLRTVIDALLTMTRLSRAQMDLQPLDLSAMAAEIVAELLEAVEGHTVQVSIAPDVRATGDREMLEVCLRNLLGNAIKYSSETRDAAVEFGQRTIGGESVYFVRDNGVGFDMKYAKNMFEPFCRLHSGDGFEGTGVGLATVHRIIEKHRGRIWTEAKPGKGATFFFTIGGAGGGGSNGS